MSSPNQNYDSYSERSYDSESYHSPPTTTPLKVTLKLKLPKNHSAQSNQSKYSHSNALNSQDDEDSYDNSRRSSAQYSFDKQSDQAMSPRYGHHDQNSRPQSDTEGSELTSYDYSDDNQSRHSQSGQNSPSPIPEPPVQPKFKIKLKLNQNETKSNNSDSTKPSPLKPKITLKIPAIKQPDLSNRHKKSLIVKLLLPQSPSPEPLPPKEYADKPKSISSKVSESDTFISKDSLKDEENILFESEKIKEPSNSLTLASSSTAKKENSIVIDLSNEPEDSSFIKDEEDEPQDENEEDFTNQGESEVDTQSQQPDASGTSVITRRRGKKKRGRPSAPKIEVKESGTNSVNNPPNRYLYPVLQRLISRLEKKDDYALFIEPVDTEAIDDYLTIVQKPMDLKTMRSKIDNREYTHIDQFKEDLILLCDNAMIYNGPDTLYYKEANKMKEFGVTSIIKQSQYILPYDPSQHPPQKGQENSQLVPETNSIEKEAKLQIPIAKSRREESVDILDFSGRYAASSTRSPSVSGMSQTTVTTAAKRRKYIRTPALPPKPPFNPDGSVEYVGQPDTTLWDHFAYGLPPVLTQLLPPNGNTVDHMIYPAAHLDFGTYPQLFDSIQSSDPLHLLHPSKLTELDPQDALLFGDGRGVAYMRSLEQFTDGLDPLVKDYVTNKLSYVTNGSYQKILNQRTNVRAHSIQPQ